MHNAYPELRLEKWWSMLLMFDDNKIQMHGKEAREETEGKSGRVNR